MTRATFSDKEYYMPFGKHQGKLIQDISSSYLRWLLEQNFFEEKWPEYYEEAENEMAWRNETNGNFED